MLVFVKNWKTRSTLHRKSFGKISHKVEPSVRFATSASHQLHSYHFQLQTLLSCCESTKRLQTGLLPNRQYCKKFDGHKVNLRWRVLCTFGSHTFVPISWACKKQRATSHSITEPETISLDAGSRMEGISSIKFVGLNHKYIALQAGGDSKLVHQTKILKHQESYGDIDCLHPNARLFSMRTSFSSSTTTKL